jgi:glycosyltransferase involved in cell wall biosynthesis
MKIIFDLRQVGLGNNGGSSTLVKSGNTLVDLGHEVIFIDSGKNQHTWTDLKADHQIIKNSASLPNADIIMATGYKSVNQTLQAPIRCGKKVHWIRGWETWQMPEDRIVKDILKVPTIKIVNGICLQKKLQHYKVKSEIIRPGYDLDQLYPDADCPRCNRGKIVIGGLYTKGKHVRIKRPNWVFDVHRVLFNKHKDKKIELWMFGNDKLDPSHAVDKYFYRPTMEYKNYFYNSVDIWLAPATQEGLHMPPAEAMLTECPVVSTNAPMSGTEDYMVHGQTGLVSENNFDSFLNCAEALVKDEFDLRRNLGKNARQMIIKLGDREKNMKNMVNYLMENI